MKYRCVERLAVIMAMVFVIILGTTVLLEAKPVDIKIVVTKSKVGVCGMSYEEVILWEDLGTAVEPLIVNLNFVDNSVCLPTPFGPIVVAFRVYTRAPGKEEWIPEIVVPVAASAVSMSSYGDQDSILFNFTKESDTVFISVDHYCILNDLIRALIVGKPLEMKTSFEK